jgi:GGDEF domain-containing protein
MNRAGYTGRLDRTTGLYAQPLLETLLHHEILRAQRYPISLALLRMAVSLPGNPDPKKIDNASVAVAQILNTSLRVADVPGHYGRDFLIILPVTDETGGLKVANRLIKLVSAEHPTPDGDKIELNACIGLSGMPEGTTIPPDTFLLQTTVALAEAQKRGPRSVVCFSEIADTIP